MRTYKLKDPTQEVTVPGVGCTVAGLISIPDDMPFNNVNFELVPEPQLAKTPRPDQIAPVVPPVSTTPNQPAPQVQQPQTPTVNQEINNV